MTTFVHLCFLILIVGCTRSGLGDKTKISISFSKDSFNQNTSSKIENVGVKDLNCFLVMASGPEEDFRRNNCSLKSADPKANSGSAIYFNQWVGGFKFDDVATLEVPSGKDRVLFLVAMTVNDKSACIDFRSNHVPKDENSSRPFLVGISDRLTLEAGQTVKIPIKISLDSTTPHLTGCAGPDVPSGSDENSGDDGGPTTPYLRIENIGRFDSALDVDLGTLNYCYPVGAGIYEGQGSGKFNTSSGSFVLDVSANGLGQFFSNATCSPGAEVTKLEIPPGQFRTSSNIYWFKPTVPTPAPTIMNVKTNITEFAVNNYQRFQFGLKKLVVSGPDRIVVNDPHVLNLTSRLFEGQTIDISGAALGVGFLNNASYYLNSDTDCSSGSTVGTSIPVSTSTRGFCFKFLSSIASVDFRDLLSTSNVSGYQVESKIISSSLGSKLAKNFKMFSESGALKWGECNEIKIQQTNGDGAVVMPLVNHEFRIDIESGAGNFYSNSDCMTIKNDKMFPLAAGTRDLVLYFKPHAVSRSGALLNRVQFQIRAGSLSTRSSRDFSKMSGVGTDVVEIPVVKSGSGIEFVPQPPDFGSADFVGTHEFEDGLVPGSFMFVPLIGDYSSISTALCSSPGDGLYSECSGVDLDTSVVPYRVKWSALRAASNTPMYVRLKRKDGSLANTVVISTDALYSGRLKVVTCTHSVSAGTNLPFSSIPVTSSANSVVCFPKDSTYIMSSAVSIILNNNLTALIGPSNRSTTLVSGAFSGFMVSSAASLTYNSDVIVANLNFDNKSSLNDGAIGINNPNTGSTSQFILNNLKIVSDQNNKMLIDIRNFSGASLAARIENINVQSSGLSSTAVYLNSASQVVVDKVDVVNTVGTGDYLKVENGGNNIVIRNSEIKFKSGTGIVIDNSASPSGLGYSISNNRIISFGNNSAYRNFLIKDKVSGYVTNNLILSELDWQSGALIWLVANTNIPSVALNGNSFINGYHESPMIEFKGAMSTPAFVLTDFNANSMAYIKDSVPSHSTLGGVFRLPVVGSTLNINVSINPPVSGANLVCSRTSYTVGMLTGAGTFVGSWNPVSNVPLAFNGFDLESGRCY